MKKFKNLYDEDSIYVAELISTILKKKSFIFKITIIFFFTGILYSLSLKNKFKASSIFYPHIEKLQMQKV